MAHQQAGRRQSGQHNQSQGSISLRSQYNTSAASISGANSIPQRMTSLDHGDDDQYPRDTSSILEQRRGYGPRSNASTQSEELFVGTGNSTYPLRSTSYAAGGSEGYQHLETTSITPNLQSSSYNPQEYGSHQTQYSPQPPSATASTFNTTHQPYIPAAYQPATYQYQPNHGSRAQGTPPQVYPSQMLPSSVQPPPPPPRLQDRLYEMPYRQHTFPPNSQDLPAGTSYTPPAPPPPPFTPSQSAFSNESTTTTSQNYSQRSSVIQSPSQDPFGFANPTHNLLSRLPTNSAGDSPRIPSPIIHRRPVGLNHSLPPTPDLNNSLPQTPGTPGPTPPQHSPQRSGTVGRHPQARPLPGPPSEAVADVDYFNSGNGYSAIHERSDGESGYEDLMQEVEAAVMGRARPSSSRRSPRVARTPNHASIDENHVTGPLFESSTGHQRDSNIQTNGNIGQIATGQYVNYDAYSDPSDAEAEAGLAAMHMADEQDAAEEARRQNGRNSSRESYGSQQVTSHNEYHEGFSSDSDVHVDMETYGGGFPGHIHYGYQDVSMPESYGYANEMDNQGRPFAATRSSQRSDLSGATLDPHGGLYDYPIPGEASIHPFAISRVDRAGTGGLSEPGSQPRRLSFEDGDEVTLAESEGAYNSASQSPARDNMPDMFFHPGVGPARPLPPAPGDNSVPQLMPAGTYQNPERLHQYDQHGRVTFPSAPEAYDQLLTPQGTLVPRSSSLVSHSSTPQMVPPIRSKTDADRAKILKQQQMGLRSASLYGTDSVGNQSHNPSAELLDLPEIPSGKRRKFNPSKLSTTDFRKCAEPWALSSIMTWIKEMSEGETDLKEQALVDGIVALFTHKVPTMNTADAEVLGAKVVRSMFDSETLLKEEEWVKFGTQSMSGVLFQLTGTGCYSPRVHTQAMSGRCYAHHCMRTLKKINLQNQGFEVQQKAEDWLTFYKLTKANVENIDKKEVERQNILHEIVTTEDGFMDQLNVLRVIYRDELSKWQPPILAPKRKESFLRDVFGKVDAIKKVNEDYLLAQLKYRQQEQGPWIVGFSDIFREWIRKAKTAYIEYAASFPNATFMIRQESERNLLFRQFLDQARENERSRRLGWDTYLKSPITRLQRYGLLLATVHKHMKKDTEEKANLAAAIEEIRVVTLECDSRVAEMTKNVDLSELQSKLQLRPGMEKVHLNLTHLGREVIFQGDLQRAGSKGISWVDTHAILFDHYLVLAKVVSARDAAGGLRHEKYDVSKSPIPMDLLVLESRNDDPVVKSSMKGIGSVTTVTTRAAAPQDTRANRQSTSSGGPGTLTHSNTSSSVASTLTNGSGKTLVPMTSLDSPKVENVMFPFRIKHLGHTDIFTLYAPTAQNRQDWCDKIIEAKTRHAASLHKQNAEPFRLKVIADTAFAYDPISGPGRSIVIKGTPLDRAIREVEEKYVDEGPRPQPVCRAAVNCATSFNQPYGNQMVAIGTDYGVYVSNYDNPRGWTRAIAASRVTHIAVLEEFSLFLLIADKSLIAYHLDTVCPVSGPPGVQNNTHDSSSRRAPQKLSGARDVGFFATGRMKDRTLVFYKKREGISSTFKVLEPVYQKSSTNGLASNMRNRFGIKKGNVEFFRDFDDFYIPSETYAINLFHSSLAISTARGIEVMTLDKKVPFSIPDLKPPDCASIAARLQGQKPLGMFRLSDSEFILVFEEVGIYANKHGDVSRAVVMEFVGRARQAALVGGMFLVLIDYYGGFVEVRNAFNGRLRQVVSGRDVRLLDDGGGVSTGKVKVAMQHPEWERGQLVVEMVVNEGLRE